MQITIIQKSWLTLGLFTVLVEGMVMSRSDLPQQRCSPAATGKPSAPCSFFSLLRAKVKLSLPQGELMEKKNKTRLYLPSSGTEEGRSLKNSPQSPNKKLRLGFQAKHSGAQSDCLQAARGSSQSGCLQAARGSSQSDWGRSLPFLY